MAPLMDRDNGPEGGYEDTPSYEALKKAGVLTTKFRRTSIEDIFTGVDRRANSSSGANWNAKFKSCWCLPGIGCLIYNATHIETFVPAGHVGFLMDEQNNYLFMQPGMHNISSIYMRETMKPQALRGHISHGNRTIVIVDQGYLGLAVDNGQPVLLPPGIHVWTSESLHYKEAVALDNHIVKLGPMTLVTVDEGYAAVTQDNGKQRVLPGGHTHLLRHKNHKVALLGGLRSTLLRGLVERRHRENLVCVTAPVHPTLVAV